MSFMFFRLYKRNDIILMIYKCIYMGSVMFVRLSYIHWMRDGFESHKDKHNVRTCMNMLLCNIIIFNLLHAFGAFEFRMFVTNLCERVDRQTITLSKSYISITRAFDQTKINWAVGGWRTNCSNNVR